MSAAIEEDKNIVHAFLYISHGTNVSSINNYYPMETKFNSIIMHSKPFESIDGKELENFHSNPCKIITGSCPYIPIEDTYGKRVFLPPLLFVNLNSDKGNMVGKYSGISYMQLKMDNNKKCSIIKTEFVYNYDNKDNSFPYDHDGLLRKYGDKAAITYSQIFKIVTDEAIRRNIKLEDVLLSIFSCQSKMNDIKYDIKIKDLLPKRIGEMKQATIFKDGSVFMKDLFVSPTIITFDKLPDGWNALAKIKHQGCGLNVLSFFGIIKENEAMEKVACLNIKGTSIFKIVDYINEHSITKRNGFVIIRRTFDDALNSFIQNFMNIYNRTNYAVLFKMYNEREHNGKFSHIGHTVAIMNHNDNFYLIDPQADISINLVKKDQLFSQQIKNVYQSKNINNNWKYIDIIFTVDSKENFDKARPVLEFNVFMTKEKDNIIVRTPDITYGGLKKIKHRKTLLSSSINKISMNKKSIKNNKKSMNKKSIKNKKKSIKNKKRSMNKNKKRNSIGGGNEDEELDDFQRIMLNIDNKNHMESALMIETSKKVEEQL
jgi:hypothetical protein